MLGAVCFWIFCRFAIFNHFSAEPVRITVFLNDFLCTQLIVDLRYSLISRFNRSINIRKMLLEIFIIQQVIFENNLLNYEDFQQHLSDVDASVKAADQRITQINNELSTQKVIQKHCDSYRLCRKVIEDCKSAKNPKAYRTKHQAEYQPHDSLKKELQDLGVTKIPSSNKIQKRSEHLESEQAATVREKQELRKKQKTLDIIRQNFTALLYAPQISNNDINRTVASTLQH